MNPQPESTKPPSAPVGSHQTAPKAMVQRISSSETRRTTTSSRFSTNDKSINGTTRTSHSSRNNNNSLFSNNDTKQQDIVCTNIDDDEGDKITTATTRTMTTTTTTTTSKDTDNNNNHDDNDDDVVNNNTATTAAARSKIWELERYISILEREYSDLKSQMEHLTQQQPPTNESPSSPPTPHGRKPLHSSLYWEPTDSRRTIDSVGGTYGGGDDYNSSRTLRLQQQSKNVSFRLSNRSFAVEDTKDGEDGRSVTSSLDDDDLNNDGGGGSEDDDSLASLLDDDDNDADNPYKRKRKNLKQRQSSIFQSSLSLSNVISRLNNNSPSHSSHHYHSSIQNAIDCHLRSQLLKITQSAKQKTHYKKEPSFRKFILLSIDPSQKRSVVPTGRRYMDPFLISTPHCLSHYPPNEPFDATALGAFCFPHGGVRLRLLPRSSLPGARRRGWCGTDGDKYCVMSSFADDKSETHAVVVSVFEEMRVMEGREGLMRELRRGREERRAGGLLVRWWRGVLPRVMARRYLVTTSQGSSRTIGGSGSQRNKNKNIRTRWRKIGKRISRMGSKRNMMEGGEGTETSFSTLSPGMSTGVQHQHHQQVMDEEINTTIPNDDDDHLVTNDERLHRQPSTRSSSLQKQTSNRRALQKQPTFRQVLLQTNGVKSYYTKWNQARMAYRHMKEMEKLGEVCLVEKVYVLMGVRDGDQSLVFAGLQRLVDAEREEQLLHLYDKDETSTSQTTTTPPPSSRRTTLKTNRHSSTTTFEFDVAHIQKSKKVFDDIFLKLSQSTHQPPHLPTTPYTTDSPLLTSHYHPPKPKQSHWYHEMKSRRQKLLRVMQIDLLPPPSSGTRLSLTLPLRNSAPINLPLPLPPITHFGLATLLLRTSPQYLILALKLLLVEQSLLIVGSNIIEVTTVVRSLLDLLKPFKWVNTAISVLPHTMMGFLGSGIPYVVGMVREDDVMEERVVREAMCRGKLGVLDLERGGLFMMSGLGVSDQIVLNFGLGLRKTLDSLTTRLTHLLTLSPNPSALRSFPTFLASGFTPSENLTLQSAHTHISTYMRNLSENLEMDFDYLQDSFTPSSFVKPLEAHLWFHKQLIDTRLFKEFVEGSVKRERMVWDEGMMEAGKRIREWVWRRWKSRGR